MSRDMGHDLVAAIAISVIAATALALSRALEIATVAGKLTLGILILQDEAETLYTEGAHDVLIPPALAAAHLYELLARPSDATLAAARRPQASELSPRQAGRASPSGHSAPFAA